MASFTVMLLGVISLIALFLIFREVYCWYGKINERLSLMQSQLNQSRETNRLLTLMLQEIRKDNDKIRQHTYGDEAATLELHSLNANQGE